MRVKHRSMNKITFDVENQFGTLAAHGYEFTLRKWFFQIQAAAKMLWVS
jgi:hypothetical protein